MDAQLQTAEPAGKLAWVTRSVAFLRLSWEELWKVSWPTWNELYLQTRAILIMSIVLGLLIGWMDLLFQLILVDGVARLTR